MKPYRFLNVPAGTPFTLDLQFEKRDDVGYLANLEVDLPGLDTVEFEAVYLGIIDQSDYLLTLSELSQAISLEIRNSCEYSTLKFKETLTKYPDVNNQQPVSVTNMSNRADF
jgi:hypothetical protein